MAVLAVLSLLCLAPTAGDVGGCGAEVVELDPVTFAARRKQEDCRRCEECALASARCRRACDLAAAAETAIPETCRPVRHDGEVCLRALRAASCEAYATYTTDGAAATPSECQFCRVAPAAPSSSTLFDGGP